MKTYGYTFSRGADVKHGSTKGESLAEVTEKLNSIFLDCELSDIHELPAEDVRRGYDGHDAKMRAHQHYVDAMRRDY